MKQSIYEYDEEAVRQRDEVLEQLAMMDEERQKSCGLCVAGCDPLVVSCGINNKKLKPQITRN